VVALLLERGGAEQLRAKDAHGRTPLALAEQHRRPQAIMALLCPPTADLVVAVEEVEEREEEEGPEEPDEQEEEEEEEQQQQQQQREAARGGTRYPPDELLEFLRLRAGATPKAIRAAISAKGEYWRLPIHSALREDKGVGLVRGLLDEGGAEQLRAKSSAGGLPIHQAAMYSSSAEVVVLLLERGGAGQLRVKTNYGDTPLALAEEYRRPEAIRALLRPPAPDYAGLARVSLAMDA
jgi:ankyrin repeat protein